MRQGEEERQMLARAIVLGPAEECSENVGCADGKDDWKTLTGWNRTTLAHKLLVNTVDAA